MSNEHVLQAEIAQLKNALRVAENLRDDIRAQSTKDVEARRAARAELMRTMDLLTGVRKERDELLLKVDALQARIDRFTEATTQVTAPPVDVHRHERESYVPELAPVEVLPTPELLALREANAPVCSKCKRLVSLTDKGIVKAHFASAIDTRPCLGSYVAWSG